MKKYKLLKDIPFAKAGDIVEMWSDGIMAFINHPNLPRFNKKDIRMFPLWFEEVEEPKQTYYIDSLGGWVSKLELTNFPTLIENLKAIGNYFETIEEAEKYLEYLKAKEVIKQDTKGYKPDWNDENDRKYCGFWDITKKEFEYMCINTLQSDSIYFNIADDIVESFKKHPKEWKTYLTYE
jgi:hypothetical protein